MDIGTRIVFGVKEGPWHIMVNHDQVSLGVWDLIASNFSTMVYERINPRLWT